MEMQCLYDGEDTPHGCFAVVVGWTKPCSDCPIKEKAQKFINRSFEGQDVLLMEDSGDYSEGYDLFYNR